MPDANALLVARRVRKTRPEHYEELLLEPLLDGDGPTTAFGSYAGWERDHSVAKRFYVGGIQWFLDETGINQTVLSSYRDRAPRRILSDTTWHTMHDPAGHWRGNLGQPQIRHACNSDPMPFIKAAQILMTCEIALEAIFREPREGQRIPEGFKSAEEIHGFMGIIPACYNIDDFSQGYLEEVRKLYPDPNAALRQAAGLRSAYPVTDLSKGMTVTRQTAILIRDYAVANFRMPGAQLGEVRARPGRYLGNGHASEREEMNVG